jgi:hypothetical protein
MFRRGQTLSGYIRREYVEGRRTFIELLPLDPASDIDYTLVESSEIVERKDV